MGATTSSDAIPAPITPPTSPVSKRVLVLAATGKTGKHVCLALKEAGFDVFGTTRSGGGALQAIGVTPITCDYTKRADLDRALLETGAKKVFAITDFFKAANKSVQVESQHGSTAIAAAKASGVEHFIFMSVADAEKFDDRTEHIKAKVIVEAELKASGLSFSIVRPCAFFENFDDAENYNPLTKGSVKSLMTSTNTFCSTYDIGRAAAAMFNAPRVWLGKTLDIISWKGDLAQVAAALETVSGVPVTGSAAMPMCARALFLEDLHHMCLYFEEHEGVTGSIDEFKKVVPNAFSAEDWFRWYNKYANGEKIVQ